MYLPKIGCQIAPDSQIVGVELYRALEDLCRVVKLPLHREDSAQVGQEVRVVRCQLYRPSQLDFSVCKIPRLGKLRCFIGMRLRLRLLVRATDNAVYEEGLEHDNQKSERAWLDRETHEPKELGSNRAVLVSEIRMYS